METKEKVHENAVIDQFCEHLDLSDVQVEKLKKLMDNQKYAVAQNITIPIELDTDDKGYVKYSKSVTTVFPVKFNATGVITFPANGTWNVKVYMNGSVIFQKADVKNGEKISLSGWTGWGTSTLVVDAQWSVTAKTHVSITISV